MSNPDKLMLEIAQHVQEVPIECQERILELARAMAFAKKCVLKDFEKSRKVKN